jgi:hypothetical protein
MAPGERERTLGSAPQVNFQYKNIIFYDFCAFFVPLWFGFFCGKNDELELTITPHHKDKLNDLSSLNAFFVSFVCFVAKVVNPIVELSGSCMFEFAFLIVDNKEPLKPRLSSHPLLSWPQFR